MRKRLPYRAFENELRKMGLLLVLGLFKRPKVNCLNSEYAEGSGPVEPAVLAENAGSRRAPKIGSVSPGRR